MPFILQAAKELLNAAYSEIFQLYILPRRATCLKSSEEPAKKARSGQGVRSS